MLLNFVFEIDTMPKSSSETPLTRAEIQRRYRERKKAENPDAFCEKERLRWHSRRRDKKVKVVEDLSERQRRVLRRNWRERQIKSRLRKKNAEANTPPESLNGASSSSRGHRVKRRSDSASYRMIVKLKQMFMSEKRAKDRYRKKLDRQEKRHAAQMVNRQNNETGRIADTPRTRTNQMLANSTVSPRIRKTLVFHNALVDEIKNTASSVKTEKHKRLVSKFIAGNVLKRSRVSKFAKSQGIRICKKQTAAADSTVNLDENCRHLRSDRVDNETAHLVDEFFNRDDNSRLTSGKKEAVTKNKLENRNG